MLLFPTLCFGDVMWTAGHWPRWPYLHHGNWQMLRSGLLVPELAVSLSPAHHMMGGVIDLAWGPGVSQYILT